MVAEQRELVLTAADGTALAAHAARPASPSGAGVVIMPDVRGLHPFYRALAGRFAEAGADAVAIDYFGRTAGVGPRGPDFDPMPHVAATTPSTIEADVAAGVNYLRSTDGPGVRAVFTVGFCFGGGNSWRLAASELDLTGVVGFYGRPALVRDVLDHVRRPLLLLVAGADQATPLSEFQQLDRRLTDGGYEHEMHVYQGAPHSFFDRAFAQWRPACEDAWRRVLDFMDRHAAGRAPDAGRSGATP